jgi:creatinine amidohydrolase/Fe(II)-dependent formamide hydrolase-like protein
MFKRGIAIAMLLGCMAPCIGMSQILKLSELSSRELQNLDRSETVIIMPGGILEEHGPYLPSFSDGYQNAWIADRLAEAIVSARGGTVLMFPTIPLGAGEPEGFGGRQLMSGSYPVRPETLRAVYMDLTSALGDDGFRTIFVISFHGAPSHNAALIDSAKYFNDMYDGKMVVLSSILYNSGQERPELLHEDERAEQGVNVHSGAIETSRLLFVQPGLVVDNYSDAATFSAQTTSELVTVAQKPDWPGYFGSPRLASAEIGGKAMNYSAQSIIDLALRILDGFDWKELPTRDSLGESDSSFRTLKENNSARTTKEKLRQEQWLNSLD